ncbi:hypothetical protein [Paraconexibacter sp.]|uniref:DoxX family protein n=1 Tax=Paraconexibacter sp. TaxID=2949640 RepID=UPI00356AF189
MTFARRFTLYAFSLTGILHFVTPKPFEAIVPDYLPAHRELVYASGATELAGALMSAHPRTRRAGGWLLLATLVGVYPANIHMAMHPEAFPQVPGGRATLIARLPLQFAFAFLVWKATLSREAQAR